MTTALDGAAVFKTAIPVVDHQVILISSDMAAEWLEKYKGPNRRISDLKVLQYQSDMEAGRWRFDGSPIRFSDEHPTAILDGQHRLTALANCVPGITLPFLVVRGLDRDSQLVMDQPQVRTVGQNLFLKGVKNASTVAAAVKFYLDWTRNRLWRTRTGASTTKPEAEEWALTHPGLLGQLFDTAFNKVDAPVSVTGAFALATLQFAPVRTHRFFHQLASGIGLQDGDPILALDRRLRNIRRTGVKVSQREYLAYFIKAWNAWVAGNSLQKIQLGHLSDETFPALLQVGDISQVDTIG